MKTIRATTELSTRQHFKRHNIRTDERKLRAIAELDCRARHCIRRRSGAKCGNSVVHEVLGVLYSGMQNEPPHLPSPYPHTHPTHIQVDADAESHRRTNRHFQARMLQGLIADRAMAGWKSSQHWTPAAERAAGGRLRARQTPQLRPQPEPPRGCCRAHAGAASRAQ